MNCKYCYEPTSIRSNKVSEIDYNLLDKIIQRINLLNSKDSFIRKFYNGININFWGGEPTISYDVIKYYLDNLKGDYTFFIYSNGYRYNDKLKQLLLENKERLVIQISYDFQPIHDMFRITKDDKITSDSILNTIDWLYENNFKFTIKSTLPYEGFKYLYEAYKDCEKFSKKYNMSYQYNPTIVQYINRNQTKESIDKYKIDINESLIKILEDELELAKNHKKTYFGMFNYNRALCSAGYSLISIDIDGKLYKCHGTLYSDYKSDHFIVDVYNDRFIEKLKESFDLHKDTLVEKDECKTCFATYCHRCNAEHYSNSTKSKYIDRWRDFSNNKPYCDFYKTISKYSIAFSRIIKNETGG
jgi:radical SAM protein with 4Fe4S-binding SPASM domain